MNSPSNIKNDGEIEIVINGQCVIDYLITNEPNILVAYAGPDLTDLFTKFKLETTKPICRLNLKLSAVIKVCLWCFNRVETLGSKQLNKETLHAKDELGRKIKSEMRLYNWAEALARVTDDTFEPKIREEFMSLKSTLDDLYINQTMVRVMELRNDTLKMLINGTVMWNEIV